MIYQATARLEENDDLAQKRELNRRLDGAVRGQVNWVGEVTLPQGNLGTVVEDDRVTENVEISLSPLTFEAAVVIDRCLILSLWPGTQWTPNRIGKFLIVHPAVSNSNVKLRYSIKG